MWGLASFKYFENLITKVTPKVTAPKKSANILVRNAWMEKAWMYYEQPTDILFKTQALFWSTCLVSGIASLILAGMKSLVAININKIYLRYVFEYLSNTFANIVGNIFCLFAKIVPTWAQLLPRRSALCWSCWGGKDFEGKSPKDVRTSDCKQIFQSSQEKVT